MYSSIMIFLLVKLQDKSHKIVPQLPDLLFLVSAEHGRQFNHPTSLPIVRIFAME